MEGSDCEENIRTSVLDMLSFRFVLDIYKNRYNKAVGPQDSMAPLR